MRIFKLMAVGGLLTGIGFAATLVGGIATGEGFDVYRGTDNFAAADPYIVDDLSGLGSISLSVRNRQVNVLPSEDDTIRVTYYQSTRDQLTITMDDGELKIRNTLSPSLFNFLINFNAITDWTRRTVSIYVPVSAALDVAATTMNGAVSVTDLPALTSVDLATENGAVTLRGLDNLASGEATTTNGSISITDCTGANFHAVSTNGTVTISDVTATHLLEADAANGNISLTRCVAPTVDAVTVNGWVHGTALQATVATLRSTNGSVTLSIYGLETDYAINLSTVNGSLTIGDASISGHAYTRADDSGKHVTLTTVNGSCNVTFLG